MRYYVEEITVLKDGSSPIAIYEKESEKEARAAFHQAMASAIINPDVESIHVEAKNNLGGVYENATWKTEVVAEVVTEVAAEEAAEEVIEV